MKRSSRKRPKTSRSSDSINRARGYALRLLGIRGRSERELGERLTKRGFEEDTVAATISLLKKDGFIDDRSLRDNLIYYAINTKALGRNGVKNLLLKRGIPKDIIDSSDIDTVDEIQGAEKLARKRVEIYKGLPKEKVKRRLYGVLQRRGYSFDTIKRVLRDVLSKD